jgi:hypothetical protein
MVLSNNTRKICKKLIKDILGLKNIFFKFILIGVGDCGPILSMVV